VRTSVVERGHDPRDFTLVAFGGAGPVHAYEIARHLGIRRIVCPPAAGVASALGFLVSPFAIDLSRTHLGRLGEFDWAPVGQQFEQLESQARQLLERSGADLAEIEILRRVDMRYAGQGYEVPVPLPAGSLGRQIEPDLRIAFDNLYRARFGTHLDTAGVECVHWRMTARVRREPGSLSFPGQLGGEAGKGRRRAFFPEVEGYADCAVLDRYRLPPGTSARGPALIEERESTIVVGPSADWEMDELGNVLISFS
jgi:N-methylhydantoinase A